MKYLLMCLMCALWVHPSPARAQTPPREAIEAAYARASLAASVHFVDGMLSYRAPGYRVFRIDPITQSRREIDLSLERERFKQLFDSAIKVKLVSLVGNLVQDGPERAHCSVSHEFLIRRLNTASRRMFTVHFKSGSDDSWTYSPRHGWRLAESVVREQSFYTEGQEELKPVTGTAENKKPADR